MAKGKYASAAKSRRIEELETELESAQEDLRRANEALSKVTLERNLLRSKDSAARMKEAGRMAANDLARMANQYSAQREAIESDTAKLLMYLVDVVARVNSGEIAAGQMPGELPGVLHHFSPRPGELFARAVGADESTDPSIAVMGNRRNRRSDVNGYRAEASRRRENGDGHTIADETLGDPKAWLSRTQGWERHIR